MEENNIEVINTDPQNPLITNKIRSALRTTKLWVTFLSILGFISTAIGIFSAAVMMSFQGIQGTMRVLMVVTSLIGIGVYLFPAIYLYRYALSIGKLLKEDSIESLEAAITRQKSFWKVIGYMVIVMFILGIAMAVVMPMF